MRHVGAEVLYWEIGAVELDAAVELGHLVPVEITPGAAYLAHDLECFPVKAVASEAEGDEGIVMRPHRSVLVGEGIKGGVTRGQGT